MIENVESNVDEPVVTFDDYVRLNQSIDVAISSVDEYILNYGDPYKFYIEMLDYARAGEDYLGALIDSADGETTVYDRSNITPDDELKLYKIYLALCVFIIEDFVAKHDCIRFEAETISDYYSVVELSIHDISLKKLVKLITKPFTAKGKIPKKVAKFEARNFVAALYSVGLCSSNYEKTHLYFKFPNNLPISFGELLTTLINFDRLSLYMDIHAYIEEVSKGDIRLPCDVVSKFTDFVYYFSATDERYLHGDSSEKSDFIESYKTIKLNKE